MNLYRRTVNRFLDKFPNFREVKFDFSYIKPARKHNDDWNRMVWAIFKTFMIVFVGLTFGLHLTNLLYYKHKWWTCNLPLYKIHYLLEDECVKVRAGLELLPKMFHKRVIGPLVQHLAVNGLACGTALIANFINDYHMSHFATYAMAVLWVHEHYHTYRLFLNSDSLIYILAHICHFMAFTCGFVFTATIIDNIHRRMEYPKFIKLQNPQNHGLEDIESA